MSRLILAIALLIGFAVGVSCGRAGAPGEPTPPPGGESPATPGAVIRGAVTASSSGSAAAAVNPLGTAAGLVVQVVGTGINAAVDASNQFLLQGVPAGDQRLRFTGPNTDAQLTLPGIQVFETIDLSVIVSGTSATIASQQRSSGVQLPINGVIQGFSGSPAAFQFTIDGRLIRGDAATEFFGNTVFADIANGRRAEVKGAQRTDHVYAVRMHVNVPEPPPAPELPASIEGILTALAGTPPNLTLTVAGTTVFTNGGTTVRRRGSVLDPSALQLGMTLHVEGIRAGDGSITARMVQIKDDGVGGTFQISGSLGGLKGTCPSVEFVVNGYKIWTDATTAFMPGCSTFKSGSKVNVQGIRQADGRVRATVLEKQ